MELFEIPMSRIYPRIIKSEFLDMRHRYINFLGLSLTNYLKLVNLSNRNVFSHSSLKSKCWQGRALSRGSRGGSFLVSPYILMAASDPWHSLFCSCITPSVVTWPSSLCLLCVSVSKSPSPFSYKTTVRLRAYSNPIWSHLNWMTSAKTVFQIRSHS